MNAKCFAYRSRIDNIDGYKSKTEWCDCLKYAKCEGCRFFKDKYTLEMVVVDGEVQYKKR